MIFEEDPMHKKVLEIRDSGTHIDAIAIKLDAASVEEDYAFTRNGFDPSHPSILLVRLTSPVMLQVDPYRWSTPGRTMQVAHDYICNHFDELHAGDVVDVQFILGETEKSKVSERLSECGTTWLEN